MSLPSHGGCHTLSIRKYDMIVSAVKYPIRRATHKYGIKILTTITEAKSLDRENGNSLWRDDIAKEMKNVGISFKILRGGTPMPVRWSKKAHWVLDGHKTADPDGSTYAGIISRESVCIAFTYAALNGIDILAANIPNAYLQAPSFQKHYIIYGLEFGLENIRKKALICRAIYSGKTAGRDFCNHLQECMSHIDFVPCL
eukprot:15345836-Ditylum_brightwellii.AAC.1